MISEICGTTPLACTLRWKISPYRPSETTPSWIRAPPESLMPMTGQPVFMRQVHDLDDLLAEDLAERPAEHREVLGEHADLAAVDRAVAGDDAVAVGAVVLEAERGERCRASSSISMNEPSSRSASIRSRAVILPLACCFSTARAEPACTASSLRRCRSASLPAVVWMSGAARRPVVLACAPPPWPRG